MIIKAGLLSSHPAGTNLVVFVPEKSRQPLISQNFRSEVTRFLSEAIQDGFQGKIGEASVVRPTASKISRYIFVGIGDTTDLGSDVLRRASASAAREAQRRHISDLYIPLPQINSPIEPSQVVTEGILLGLYQYSAYQNHPEEPFKLKSVSLLVEKPTHLKTTQTGIKLGTLFSNAVVFVRDLVNTPPSEMDPLKMAKIAQATIKKPCRMKIFRKNELVKMGMGALLGVNRGSAKEAVFIHLIYRPPHGKIRRRIGICGKGITFDSGGLSLKPAKSMETMKDDMSGAATVFALFQALAVIKPPVEVHGFAPITENMPGGDALKPGDVLRTLSGKTIEVLNTDAEGRLVLSDALGFAGRHNLDELIDIATLTGACVVALGPQIAGLMGTDQDLLNRILKAANLADEKLWTLPLEKEYEAMLKSYVADIKNIGPAGVAGTILGGLFLKKFVKEGLPWAHMDIASTAWTDQITCLSQPGATGVMVRTLLTYLLSYQ